MKLILTKIVKRELEVSDNLFCKGRLKLFVEDLRKSLDLKYLGYKQHYGKGYNSLWAIGYYCGSAGHVSQEAVKRYIQEQEGKEIFEYSVFGSPQQKIGDFTQTKIGGFS
jgi:REP element-mobilizing transposase RayT